jgi:hypothetical protein
VSFYLSLAASLEQSHGAPVHRRELTNLAEAHVAVEGHRVGVPGNGIYLTAKDLCSPIAGTQGEFLVEPASGATTPKPTIDSHLIDVHKTAYRSTTEGP